MQVLAHNLAAQFTNRQLNITTNQKAKSSEKLSSGYRINRSADDAAGLSISEKMRKQIRGLNQASENIQDGISLCQVADGALSETTEMLQRMRVLSIQAANGTNSESDRNAIQQEIDQLTKEVDRIATTTSFNDEIHPLNICSKDNISQKQVTPITPKTILENYPSYIATDGKQHYILGSGIYKIENLTDVVFDVSGNVTIADTNLKNVSIQCAQGTTLNVSNVTIDNSENIQNDIKGIGAAIQFKGIGNTLNCYGDNEFNGGMDTYNIYTDSIDHTPYYVACAGINVGKDVELTINGTTTSNLIAHGCNSKEDVNYGNEQAIGMDSPAIGSNFHEDGGHIIINSGNLKAYAEITERLGMGYRCIGGGNNVSVTINGGNIYSYGGTIGGGDTYGDNLYQVGNATITINGGIINATASLFPAIGIDSNGEITINGGTINANGGYAIGGGNYWASNAIININGGNITATATRHGYGVAIGFSSSESQVIYPQPPLDASINFNGGTVVAKVIDGFPYPVVGLFEWAPATNTYNGSIKITENGTIVTPTEISDGNRYRKYEYSAPYTPLTEPESLKNNLDKNNIKSLVGVIPKLSNTVFNDRNIWIQAGAETNEGLFLTMVNATAKGLGIKEPDISVMSEDDCDNAMNRLNDAISKVSSYRSLFGAQQNRLESSKAVNDSTAENTQYAESRIRDTDMATEMVNFRKNNILVQAGQSMLAQANQSTQSILSLLQ